jgi:uncharacterized protein with GYD domain
MSLYWLRATYSPQAFKGMITEPQDREAAARGLFEAVGVTMHSLHFSVSTGEVVVLGESTAQSLAAVEMVVMASGGFSSVEAIEVISAREMTEAMKIAAAAAGKYAAPSRG